MLSDAAPADPLPVIKAWLDEATASGQHNPDALALATVDGRGAPSVRMVLMRGLSLSHGYAVFYTNYQSRKSADLDTTSVAAGVIYWSGQGRQVRVEGRVVRSPAAESDAYFGGRPIGGQINAHVSEQSRPLVDRVQLIRRAEAMRRDLAAQPQPAGLARPEHWGGYRLWFAAVELWQEGGDRFHDRIRYERELMPLKDGTGFSASQWRHQRLQP